MAERLGNGLQNRAQQFESAWDLDGVAIRHPIFSLPPEKLKSTTEIPYLSTKKPPPGQAEAMVALNFLRNYFLLPK